MIIFTIIVAITIKWKWQSVKIRTICELGGALMCVKGWGKGDRNRYYKKKTNKNGLVKMLSSISFPNNWNVSDVFLHLIAAIPMQGLLEKIHWMRGGINHLNKPKQNIKKIFPAFFTSRFLSPPGGVKHWAVEARTCPTVRSLHTRHEIVLGNRFFSPRLASASASKDTRDPISRPDRVKPRCYCHCHRICYISPCAATTAGVVAVNWGCLNSIQSVASCTTHGWASCRHSNSLHR